jgi:Putative polyhydroxyalkanoic acid system protein (PHA_gran_rgn)
VAASYLTGTRIVPEPIVLAISHALGREEAKRRLDNGLGYIREQLAAFVSSADYGWTGYRLDFGLTAMRQSITGRIEVEDRLVRVELGLPLLLHLLLQADYRPHPSRRCIATRQTKRHKPAALTLAACDVGRSVNGPRPSDTPGVPSDLWPWGSDSVCHCMFSTASGPPHASATTVHSKRQPAPNFDGQIAPSGRDLLQGSNHT